MSHCALLDQFPCGWFIVHDNRLISRGGDMLRVGAVRDIILRGTPGPVATSAGVDFDTSASLRNL